MNPLNNKDILKFISYFSIFSILFAFYVEFFLGHKPCNLCLLERIPYFAAILITILSFVFKNFKKIAFLIIGIIFLLSTILSIYHVGIEQGLIEESFICRSSLELNTLDKEQLLRELEKSVISCKNVTFYILGFSLATINIFVSIIISFITLRIFYKYEKK